MSRVPSRWREQYDRLDRWYIRLRETTVVDEHHLDDFYAFFITCFHLKDWLKADHTLDSAVGKAAEALVNTNDWLKLCADLANGSKHLVINQNVRVDATAHLANEEWVIVDPDVLQEHGPERGIKRQEVPMVWTTGGGFFAADAASHCLTAWQRFLQDWGLLRAASGPSGQQPESQTGTSSQ